MTHIYGTVSCRHTTKGQSQRFVWHGALEMARNSRTMPPGKYTFARAFLQLRQAFRVTESGTFRPLFDAVVEALILPEVLMLPASPSLSPRGSRGSLPPVLSDVDWLGLLGDADALPPSPKDGLILRRFEDISEVNVYGQCHVEIWGVRTIQASFT